MKDDRHAALHFSHLTNAEPLNRKIEENLTVHLGEEKGNIRIVKYGSQCLGYLETYLQHMINTVEFKTKLDNVEMTSQIHFRGSSQLKDITILVFLAVRRTSSVF